MRLGTLDVGSNTVRLLVAHRESEGWRVLSDVSRLTGLGRGLGVGGPLDPVALGETLEAVGGYADEARRAGVDELVCVVTAGARGRPGAAAALDAIGTAAGVKPRLLSPREEATFAYLGALHCLPPLPGVTCVVDIGGGSTEIASGSDPMRPEILASLPLGARRQTEAFLRHDPPTVAEVALLRQHVATALGHRELKLLGGADRIVGVGGTIVTLGELAFGQDGAAAGRLLTAQEVAAHIAVLASQPVAERARTLTREPGRADVIVAGAIILHELLDALDAAGVIVSYGGLRHGLLATWGEGANDLAADLPR